MATVGKNILENLTTGMYSDSKVIYREYIQNACDQIDIAIEKGILSPEEANIDVYFDFNERYISIKDNATGVKASDFINDVGDIANSNKEIGKNKGFRGIGRLCGLAYCKTLKFTTSHLGENIKSIMICDAQKMRLMLAEKTKYTLDEIWEAIISYSTENENTEAHYFEVELIDINKENTDLLDNELVQEYLSFVAPVPYKNTFIFRTQIYEHASQIDYKIDEYNIKINGNQIFKEYATRLKEKSGNNLKDYDEISLIEFKDFYDKNGKFIAWMWIGLSRFEKQIPMCNSMRGLRLRSANIQLGGNNALEALFKEQRGNYYFVGEVFAVSDLLIPNSQRDYFNENEERVVFENLIRGYCFDVLHKIYNGANKLKNDLKRHEEYQTKVLEYNEKEESKGFINEDERQKMILEIDGAKKKMEEANKRLGSFEKNLISPLAKVKNNIDKKYGINNLIDKSKVADISNNDILEKKKTFVTDGMSKLSRNERKLVSKILAIITDTAPKEVAEQIIEKIKEEMR